MAKKRSGSVDSSSEYIVNYRTEGDPSVERRTHTFLVKMTQDEAEALYDYMKRLFDAGIIIGTFDVVLADLVRVSPHDLRSRLNYVRHKNG